ncbi:MAG: hypothetical protein R2825_19895 [Saprospiraceae bacterium]
MSHKNPASLMDVTIKEVKTKSELKQFVKFPFDLYQGQPHWIPPIIQAEMELLSKDKNPVFEHSKAVIYTAWQEEKMVGRIVGLINEMENDFIQGKHARFGWFDFIDDRKVSKALIQAVEKWAKSQGMELLKGPYGFNQLDKNGWLTEGFDSSGTVNSIYNYPYYPEHIKSLGYTPDLEWVELTMQMPEKTHERFIRFTEIAKEKYGLTIRQPTSKKEMLSIGQQMFDLLMDTYQNLPGFVPISKKQQNVYINRYVKFLKKDFVAIVYDKKNEPIAFGVTIPSMTNAYKKANGRLFPFGLFHILAARQWNDTADLALIGVKEEWRKKGAHGLVFSASSNAVIAAGIKRILINPMLETNSHVLSLWKDFDHRIYKRRKSFKRYIVDA